MGQISLQPEFVTNSGEASSILVDNQYVGTMTLLYREEDRLWGSVQLDEEMLHVDEKEEIDVMSELTGLSERQIRYYEDRKLIYPDRTKGGTRKYSFQDVELLMKIANQMEDGLQTYEIRKLQQQESKQIRDRMIRGQLNAHFNMRK